MSGNCLLVSIDAKRRRESDSFQYPCQSLHLLIAPRRSMDDDVRVSIETQLMHHVLALAFDKDSLGMLVATVRIHSRRCC